MITNVYYENYNTTKVLNVSCSGGYFSASVNPYIGCVHSCKYCYVQAEKYSKNISSEEFFKKVKVKVNIIEKLIKEISLYKDKYHYGVVYLGTSSDPYQPVEEIYKFSRKVAEIILRYTFFSLHIFTKSDLILSDLDLFKKYKDRVAISVSLITVDEKLKRIFEPYSSSVAVRLEVISELVKNGIYCGCAIMPVLPYISDSETVLDDLIRTISRIKVKYIWWGYLTLRENITQRNLPSQKEVYYDVIKCYFPELVERYSQLYRNRISPGIGYQRMIDKRIYVLSKKYNIDVHGPKLKFDRNFIPESSQFVLKF